MWLVQLGMLSGILKGFPQPFLYFVDEYGTWSTCYLQMTCICHFDFKLSSG